MFRTLRFNGGQLSGSVLTQHVVLDPVPSTGKKVRTTVSLSKKCLEFQGG